MLAVDLSTVPAWAVLVIFLLALLLPLAIRWARSTGHNDLADELERTRKLAEFLASAIVAKDHTGTVAAHVEENAGEHGLEDHPLVKKVTG